MNDNEPTTVARSPFSPVVVTADGSLVPFLELREEHVHGPEHVARALAYRQRWAGCTPLAWSVASHSIAGAKYFSRQGHKDLALAFLLHDAGEAFLPDLPAPLKPLVTLDGEPWEVIERDHLEVILAALGAPWGLARLIVGEQVRKFDAALALRERDTLMPDCEKPWALDFRAEPAEGVEVRPGADPDKVAEEWVRTFRILVEEVLP